MLVLTATVGDRWTENTAIDSERSGRENHETIRCAFLACAFICLDRYSYYDYTLYWVTLHFFPNASVYGIFYPYCLRYVDLEWWLVQKGAVTTSELDENPRSRDYTADDAAGDNKLTTASKYAKERRNYEMDEEDDD